MELFILESKEDVFQFIDIIKKNVNCVVIASSIEAHQYLKKMDIKHELADNYFTKLDYNKIDSLAIDFSLNWHPL